MELSNVLESLNKLAELEKRITSLEKDNIYEHMLQSEKPAANDRTVMDFRKARVPMQGGDGPMGVVYAMRPKKASWQVQVPPKRGVGGGMAAVRAAKQSQGGGGVFLTEFGQTGGMDESDDRRDAVRRERQKQMALATAGQKNLRGRLQSKRGREKEVAIGNRKHEEAMRELNRRRNEQQIQKRPARGAGAAASKGASAGIKTKNKHLRAFEQIKSSHKKRKGGSECLYFSYKSSIHFHSCSQLFFGEYHPRSNHKLVLITNEPNSLPTRQRI